jgi:hypothetical protein
MPLLNISVIRCFENDTLATSAMNNLREHGKRTIPDKESTIPNLYPLNYITTRSPISKETNRLAHDALFIDALLVP